MSVSGKDTQMNGFNGDKKGHLSRISKQDSATLESLTFAKFVKLTRHFQPK